MIKRMKDANALDNIHGSLSDQEGTSGPEGYDEEDSVEEKQDSEPMNDWESTKVKSSRVKSDLHRVKRKSIK